MELNYLTYFTLSNIVLKKDAKHSVPRAMVLSLAGSGIFITSEEVNFT